MSGLKREGLGRAFGTVNAKPRRSGVGWGECRGLADEQDAHLPRFARRDAGRGVGVMVMRGLIALLPGIVTGVCDGVALIVVCVTVVVVMIISNKLKNGRAMIMIAAQTMLDAIDHGDGRHLHEHQRQHDAKRRDERLPGRVAKQVHAEAMGSDHSFAQQGRWPSSGA